MVVSIEKAVIARLHHSGIKFEILIDPYKALDFKKGVKIDINDVLAYPAIYHDVRNTETVPESDLQKAFGTTDVLKIAEKIIKEGELQLTTEQRREMVENKRAQIADIISKRGVNPQTNSPNPPQRVLGAMEKAGVNVDPFLDAEMQIEKVLKAIKPIIPISLQKVTIQLKIPAQFAGKSYTVLKNYGKVVSEQWLNDGSLQISLQILAGIQEELYQKISSLAHGQFESKIIKKEEYGS
ncbi:MAG TPA: ribosome assembly factor SBDS [archaeon]|nr:ribosome assembly factor SBDS [archaeon]